MQSEWNRGASYARDHIMSRIIGMQNDVITNENGERYKALQDLLEVIERDCGEFMKPYIG